MRYDEPRLGQLPNHNYQLPIFNSDFFENTINFDVTVAGYPGIERKCRKIRSCFASVGRCSPSWRSRRLQVWALRTRTLLTPSARVRESHLSSFGLSGASGERKKEREEERKKRESCESKQGE